MKITISNIQLIDPPNFNTYGYFSLGKVEINVDSLLLSSTGFPSIHTIKCTCNAEGWDSFDTYLFQIGFSKDFIVLSDFSKIPDIAVLESEKILEFLKIEVLNYLNERSVTSITEKYLATATDLSVSGRSMIGYLSNNYYGTSSFNTLSSASTKLYRG